MILKIDDATKILYFLETAIALAYFFNISLYRKEYAGLKDWIRRFRREKWMEVTNERFIFKGQKARTNSRFISYVFNDEDVNDELVKNLKLKLRFCYKTNLVLVLIGFVAIVFAYVFGFIIK